MNWTKELLAKCHNELGQAFGFLPDDVREAMESVKDIAPFDAVTYNGEWYDVSLRYLFAKTGIYRINPSWIPDELKPRKLTVADLPDGYDFGAVERNGKAFAYIKRPTPNMHGTWTTSQWQATKEIPGIFDASDWQNSLVERQAVKDDWRAEYVRYPVERHTVEDRTVMGCWSENKILFATLSAMNCAPGAVFEWPDGEITETCFGPDVSAEESEYNRCDPRTWRYEYPVAVWLPKGASK